MEKIFVVVGCTLLEDQYECEANRELVAMTDDWEKYCVEHGEEIGNYEVYEWDGSRFNIVKKMCEYNGTVMALYYWDQRDDRESRLPHVVEEWLDEDIDRDSEIPASVINRITKNTSYNSDGDIEWPDDSLSDMGFMSWYDKDGRFWVYGEREYHNFNKGGY